MLFELLTLSAPMLIGDPGTATVELSHRRYREWTIELPAESFTAIGNGIRLGDDRMFAAELEGTNLLLDLDGDGVTDVRIEGDEGSVLLKTEDGFRYAVRLARGAPVAVARDRAATPKRARAALQSGVAERFRVRCARRG